MARSSHRPLTLYRASCRIIPCGVVAASSVGAWWDRTRMNRHMKLLVSVLAAVFLITATPAEAALYLIFSKASAKPGQRIAAYSATEPGRPIRWDAAPKRTRVYLVPLAFPLSQPTSNGAPRSGPPPRSARVAYLGRLVRQKSGELTIGFRLPNLRPGLYTTAFWCIPCHPPRGSFFPSALADTSWQRHAGPVLRIQKAR
jgi:hypothetical protein